MEVVCTHCGHEASLPADKIPDRAFTFSCPKCKEKVRVDPTGQPKPEEASSEIAGFEALPPISVAETDLVATAPSLAYLVFLEKRDRELIREGVELLGINLVREFEDLETAIEAFSEAVPSLFVVRMAKVPAPPCPPLAPLLQVPPQERRRSLVALVGDNVRSLDGQTAFFLQVNCLIASQDMARFPQLLRRAWLFHLIRYRFWKGDLGAD